MILKPRLFRKLRYGPHWSKTGLVGLWLMNEGSGNTVFDLSGNGNDGTFIANTHFVPGKFGPSLDFDGVGDYVVMSGSGADWTEDFTQISVGAWVRNDEIELSNVYAYVCKGEAVSGIGSWSLIKGPDEKWYFRVEQDGAVGGQATSGVNVDEDLDWHYLVGTWDGTTVRLYVDGILQATTGLFSGTIRDAADNVTIGGEDGGARLVNGQIDHVLLFNRALSASEITQLYRNPFIMFDRDEIELWVGSVGAAVGANPKGPLGHPLCGALAGPISF